MTLGELRVLPVADLAEDDCHLYLWVTPEMHRLGEGVRLANVWGFAVVGEIIWHKPNFGMGAFPRPAHEPVLVCRRGVLPFNGGRDVGSVQRWAQERGQGNGGKRHSRKPDGLMDLAERVSPGPYLELFARRARLGWETWGHESLGTAEMPEAASSPVPGTAR